MQDKWVGWLPLLPMVVQRQRLWGWARRPMSIDPHSSLPHNTTLKQMRALQGQWAYRDTGPSARYYALGGSLPQLSKTGCLVTSLHELQRAIYWPRAWHQQAVCKKVTGICYLTSHNLSFLKERETTSNKSSLPLVEQIYISFSLWELPSNLFNRLELKQE